MALRLSTGLRNYMMGHASGDDLKALLALGVLEIYSGSQPADANSAESGTKLCRISSNGGTYGEGSAATNGLEFGNAVAGVISKKSGQTWKGTNLATGTAGWFRFYAGGPYISGASASALRFDGAVATSGSQLNLTSTSLTISAELTIDSFDITLPAS